MRKPVALIVGVLLAAMSAVGQQASTRPEATTANRIRKAVSLAGAVSDDARMFVRDSDSSVWTIDNPESLKGYEGQSVRLQGLLVPEKNEMHVLLVKTAKHSTQYLTQKDDSAFRR
jgi:hypothetical protein